MGLTYAKQKLFHSIDCRNGNDVTHILTKYPSLSNEFFDKTLTCLPLTRASWLGYNDIIEVLLKFGADINKPTSNNQTPLFFAVQKGRKHTVEFLLSKDAQLEVADSLGYTPLDFAIIWGYYNIALLLHRRVL